MKKEPQYITKAGLKGKRGWTDLLIKYFLPKPDTHGKNAWYGNETYLYLLSRVETIEATAEFKVMKTAADVRRRRAGKAVLTKKNNIISYIYNLRIKVPVFTKAELVKKACASYNTRNAWKQHEEDKYWTPADESSDETFLNRICINYLRHQCTSYEKQLENIFGKVGNEEAYALLKKKVNEAILNAYDFLEPVPERQFE